MMTLQQATQTSSMLLKQENLAWREAQSSRETDRVGHSPAASGTCAMPSRRNNLADCNKCTRRCFRYGKCTREQTPPRSGICRNFPTFPHWRSDVFADAFQMEVAAAIFSAGRLKVRTMDNRRFRSMTPAGEAAFLADKETTLFETLARRTRFARPGVRKIGAMLSDGTARSSGKGFDRPPVSLVLRGGTFAVSLRWSLASRLSLAAYRPGEEAANTNFEVAAPMPPCHGARYSPATTDRFDRPLMLSNGYSPQPTSSSRIVAILAEERIDLAVKRAAALTYGDFGNVA